MYDCNRSFARSLYIFLFCKSISPRFILDHWSIHLSHFSLCTLSLKIAWKNSLCFSLLVYVGLRLSNSLCGLYLDSAWFFFWFFLSICCAGHSSHNWLFGGTLKNISNVLLTESCFLEFIYTGWAAVDTLTINRRGFFGRHNAKHDWRLGEIFKYWIYFVPFSLFSIWYFHICHTILK